MPAPGQGPSALFVYGSKQHRACQLDTKIVAAGVGVRRCRGLSLLAPGDSAVDLQPDCRVCVFDGNPRRCRYAMLDVHADPRHGDVFHLMHRLVSRGRLQRHRTPGSPNRLVPFFLSKFHTIYAQSDSPMISLASSPGPASPGFT